jgi:DNA-binding NtrC family response regulator
MGSPDTALLDPVTGQLALLVVDDDIDFCAGLVAILRSQGFDVVANDSVQSARATLGERAFDAVLIDLHLPDGDGLDLLADRRLRGDADFIVITGHGSISTAVDALKRGAHDYLTKPVDPARLKSTLHNLRRAHALKRELRELRADLVSRGRFGAIVGRSEAMKPVFEHIARVAPTDASVFIEGESGTGKEMVAEAIHELSRRRDAPLLPLNCGAIAETLIESELFGHERGSFTGADRQHRGFFERANGGTLFLDEITEMPARLQTKFLRVIETGKVQRIGGAEQIPIDVRVVAATNRKAVDAIRSGLLREDLFFRLAVFPIVLPPLRERRGDVSLLAEHFLAQLNEAHDTRKSWQAGALEELEGRDWTGNVRELKNAVHRAYILSDGVLTADRAVAVLTNDLMPAGACGPLASFQPGSSIADVERVLILATVEHAKGDKQAAAKMLGISVKTLYTRLKVYKAARR